MNRKPGYTTIELLVVIAIVVILTTVLFPVLCGCDRQKPTPPTTTSSVNEIRATEARIKYLTERCDYMKSGFENTVDSNPVVAQVWLTHLNYYEKKLRNEQRRLSLMENSPYNSANPRPAIKPKATHRAEVVIDLAQQQGHS